MRYELKKPCMGLFPIPDPIIGMMMVYSQYLTPICSRTRDINRAVKNNPDKFPDGYLFELTKDEFEILRRKFSTTKFSKTRTLPKAFTEKGLYMLATILKSENAIQATLMIIETFAKVKELSRNTGYPLRV